MGFSSLDYRITDDGNGIKMNFGLKVENINSTNFVLKLRYELQSGMINTRVNYMIMSDSLTGWSVYRARYGGAGYIPLNYISNALPMGPQSLIPIVPGVNAKYMILTFEVHGKLTNRGNIVDLYVEINTDFITTFQPLYYGSNIRINDLGQYVIFFPT